MGDYFKNEQILSNLGITLVWYVPHVIDVLEHNENGHAHRKVSQLRYNR